MSPSSMPVLRRAFSFSSGVPVLVRALNRIASPWGVSSQNMQLQLGVMCMRYSAWSLPCMLTMAATSYSSSRALIFSASSPSRRCSSGLPIFIFEQHLLATVEPGIVLFVPLLGAGIRNPERQVEVIVEWTTDWILLPELRGLARAVVPELLVHLEAELNLLHVA